MEQFEADYRFQRKGKKYKERYFNALNQLHGDDHATEGKCHTAREVRTDTICDLVEESGVPSRGIG